MNTVYVIQDSERNISAAKEYGELCVILSYADIEKGLVHVTRKLKRELYDIKPDDFLLCIGDPVAIGIAMHIALKLTRGRINVLKWDRRKYKYKKEEIEVNHE